MKLWFPIYTSTILINMIIPLWISHSLLVIGTIQHFSQDRILPLPLLFGYFSGSILLRKSIIVQESILGFSMHRTGSFVNFDVSVFGVE